MKILKRIGLWLLEVICMHFVEILVIGVILLLLGNLTVAAFRNYGKPDPYDKCITYVAEQHRVDKLLVELARRNTAHSGGGWMISCEEMAANFNTTEIMLEDARKNPNGYRQVK